MLTRVDDIASATSAVAGAFTTATSGAGGVLDTLVAQKLVSERALISVVDI